MADINPSPLLQSPYRHTAADPKPLIISQFSDPQTPNLLKLTIDSLSMERGPRFKEYSALRERKLRINRLEEQPNPERETEENVENRSVLTPRRKQVKFSSNFTTPPKRTNIPSVLTQSVPDFSPALRKENRTPPPGMSKSGRMYGKVAGGSKSTSLVEKKSGGIMARKSYANMDELKKLGVSAGKETNSGKRRNFY